MADPARQPTSEEQSWKNQFELDRAVELNAAAAEAEEADEEAPPQNAEPPQPELSDVVGLSGEQEVIEGEDVEPQSEEEAVASDPVERAKAIGRARRQGGAGGGGGSGGGIGGAEGALAAAALGGGEMDQAQLKKMAIEKFVWPLVTDPTGVITGIWALTFLQGYWILSMLEVQGTVKMKLWEHVVLFVLTLLEMFAIVGGITLMLMLFCLISPSCAATLAWQSALNFIGL